MKLKTIGQHGALLWISICLLCCSLAGTGIASAQEDGLVPLQIRLRASDGSAIAGEPMVLQRLPEEEEIIPACRTDVEGVCVWRVGRGLYQLLFNRPLDTVSALAVAEGGLRGLGITVGDVDIAYHFTFHSDNRVYFDAAPDAAVPLPIIPESDALHGGVAATPAPATVIAAPVDLALPNTPTATPIGSAAAPTPSLWEFLFLIGLGLVVGGTLHFWTRKRKQPDQSGAATPRQATKEVEDA